ncbi:site-specific integrase [Halomonas sp. KAO]|uniref:tyrosine-type recombinase/integrase n=1 Tax=Halomonas sp. KAO TaxID=2783858 RepID=UPI00189E97BC|nr:site-specific integrase [Halomonas sp. KAO]MBF7052846.1 site-specific integrase [Halomonas sp. KAO]
MKTFTFDDLLQSYFSERWLTERSRTSYCVPVKLFRRFLGQEKLPEEVTREDVRKWRDFCFSESGRNLSHSSWNNYCRHNRILFKHAIDHALMHVSSNPFVKMEVSSPKKRKKTLNKRQVEMAREAIDLHKKIERYRNKPSVLHPAWFWEVVFETFYHTGIRLTQLLLMKPEDIDLKGRVLTATWQGAKNNREHFVPISNALYPHLENLMNSARMVGIKRGEQIFNVNRFSVRHRMETMDSWQVESFYQKLSQICGYQMSPHRFRHTLGTELMKEPDRNLHIVKALLGHSNISTTLEYVEVDIGSLRSVIEGRT